MFEEPEVATAFLTGSRVYGTPRPDSDIDVVALVDEDTLKKMAKLVSEMEALGSPGGPHYEDGFSLRFGMLNLILLANPKHFEVWKEGSSELEAQKPVTRDHAIEHLRALRSQHRIKGW